MFRRVRNILRNIIGSTIVRADAMMTMISPDPNVINSPCEYYHLKNLLKMYYKCDIELVSENVTFSSLPHNFPHMYHMRVGLKTLENPDEITYLLITAKILGVVEKRKIEKKNIYYRFEREMIMYREVIPTMKAIQQAWDRTLKFQYCDLFPECYGARLSLLNPHAHKPDHSAALLIQNLRESGYFNFTQLCDYNRTFAIVQRLAQLHAIPLTMRVHEQVPYVTKIAKILYKVNQYKDIFDPEQEYEKIFNAISTEHCLARYQPEIFRQLQNYADKIYRDYITDSTSWLTICHSKCSILNMLVLKDHDFHTRSIKFVNLGDVQLESCCSDLLYFLLTSTTSEVLENYFDDILEVYFAEFKRIMIENFIFLDEHTFPEFMTEFNSRAYVSVGRMLYEIGLLYYSDCKDDEKFATGINYKTKIITVLKCMINRNWLK